MTEREKQLLRREGFTDCWNEIRKATRDAFRLVDVSGYQDQQVRYFGGVEAYVERKYPLPSDQTENRHALTCAKTYCIGTHRDLVDCTCGSEEATTPKRGVTFAPNPFVVPTHCDECDRPEICDLIKRGTGPCSRNTGVAPAAVKVIDELRLDRENDGAGEAGGLLSVEVSPEPAPTARFRSASCDGEWCTLCGARADAKVEETLFHDDPFAVRHPYTAYVCAAHFDAIMHCGVPENIGSPWPRDPRANTESCTGPLAKTREIL